MGSDEPVLPLHSTPSASRSGSPERNTASSASPFSADRHDLAEDVLSSRTARGHWSRSHRSVGSNRSSLDSQRDVMTAVNSPMDITPSLSRYRFSRDSHGEEKEELAPTTDRKEDKPRAHGLQLPNGLAKSTSRLTAQDQELELRRSVTHGGEEKHRNAISGKGGVREKKETVDLGRGEEEVIIIDWLPDDPNNPMNWSKKRKWIITLVLIFLSLLTAFNVTSVAYLANYGPAWFNCTREEFLLSLTMTMLAISITPMVLAPLSEVFGRNMIYQVTSVLTAVLFIPQATSHSYAGLLVARWFQGMSCSVGNSMVGGSIADLFAAKDRGLAMNFFALAIFVGQSGGGFIFGWVAQDWGIQWAYGLQGILGAFSILLNILFLRETRADVLLTRRAAQLTKETGKKHVCAADLQKSSLKTLMTVSLVRPFQYLLTEPIVTALSIWIGFAWAIIFLNGASVQLVFGDYYGFNVGETGSIQVALLIGGVIGFFLNFHQDRLYAKAAAKNGGRAPPEARLYYAAWGGLIFPLGLFAFAWSGRPGIPWEVPAVVFTIANVGIYFMYHGVYSYFADAYEIYSSSAQASQCFARNAASAFFPLFAQQLYKALGYPQATTLVASLALLFHVAPILILLFGAKLRAKSRIATALARET